MPKTRRTTRTTTTDATRKTGVKQPIKKTRLSMKSHLPDFDELWKQIQKIPDSIIPDNEKAGLFALTLTRLLDTGADPLNIKTKAKYKPIKKRMFEKFGKHFGSLRKSSQYEKMFTNMKGKLKTNPGLATSLQVDAMEIADTFRDHDIDDEDFKYFIENALGVNDGDSAEDGLGGLGEKMAFDPGDEIYKKMADAYAEYKRKPADGDTIHAMTPYEAQQLLNLNGADLTKNNIKKAMIRTVLQGHPDAQHASSSSAGPANQFDAHKVMQAYHLLLDALPHNEGGGKNKRQNNKRKTRNNKRNSRNNKRNSRNNKRKTRNKNRL